MEEDGSFIGDRRKGTMEKNEMLRSVLFGGYGKESVHKYIEALEKRGEEIQVSHQKEKDELTRKLQEHEEYRREQEEQISKLQKELAQVKTEFQEQIRISKKMESELLGREAKCAAAEKQWKEEAEKVKRLEKGLQKQTEKNENDFLDYQTITKVLEDVTRDADMMRAEAQEEGRKIVAAAIVEAETRKNVIAKRAESELEEKAIQLVAAKHKITEYMKGVNDAQQGLYEIYSRLHRMVEGMPIRLEEFWDGEEYRALEQSMSKKKDEEEQSNNM